jgi:hypothetical protein
VTTSDTAASTSLTLFFLGIVFSGLFFFVGLLAGIISLATDTATDGTLQLGKLGIIINGLAIVLKIIF